ncbi:MAG: glyoxylate/hydroxypyruvate reductase A [Betaproteobacteria bacterium]|nr:glyoxylate/hydroxypyruvate reductase A [Betaproteobacteria bacterium]NBT67465.1 glyoxylate/hydroxypyruvate reductase A [Betaproteobacteria bacterium]NBY08407.1 glyoxylate/hydroxypyruvate reductase A [Betaproteobacteria bacterium]
MRIAVALSHTSADPWVKGLQNELPAHQVYEWNSGEAPADTAVVWTPPQVFFDQHPHLKVVFNTGAGVDALLKLILPINTSIIRLEDAGMSVQMCEYVLNAVVRHFREFDVYATSQVQSQWQFRKPRVRSEFPVGVMGLGVLGAKVAQTLKNFDFVVNGWSQTLKQIEGVRCFNGISQLSDFLKASKFLICLLPLTTQTENILNHSHLSMLQQGGYLINVARGAHVVDGDLIALLDSGHLAGATLDVFRQEPLTADHPFWLHPKITLTPHTSARTMRDETILQIAGKIKQWVDGVPLSQISGLINRERGY